MSDRLSRAKRIIDHAIGYGRSLKHMSETVRMPYLDFGECVKLSRDSIFAPDEIYSAFPQEYNNNAS